MKARTTNHAFTGGYGKVWLFQMDRFGIISVSGSVGGWANQAGISNIHFDGLEYSFDIPDEATYALPDGWVGVSDL